MNVVVMGCGRIGTQIVIALWKEGHNVTVLDSVGESFLSLPKELQELEGATIVSDGILEEELIEAGIQDACRNPPCISLLSAAEWLVFTSPVRSSTQAMRCSWWTRTASVSTS